MLVPKQKEAGLAGYETPRRCSSREGTAGAVRELQPASRLRALAWIPFAVATSERIPHPGGKGVIKEPICAVVACQQEAQREVLMGV